MEVAARHLSTPIGKEPEEPELVRVEARQALAEHVRCGLNWSLCDLAFFPRDMGTRIRRRYR